MLFEQSPLYLENFVLILTRVSAVIMSAPVFSTRGMPPHTRIGLAVFITLIFLPLHSSDLIELPPGLFPFAFAIGRELLVGLAVGFAVTLLFTGLQMAAHLMSLQMGLTVGELLDPITGAQSNPLEQFYSVLVMLIFLTINGHYQLLIGMQQSFNVVPLATFDTGILDPDRAILLSAGMFLIALRITMPIMAAMLLADLGMAVIARAMPQMPVFIVGMPAKVAVGIIALMITLPATGMAIGSAFGQTLPQIDAILTGR